MSWATDTASSTDVIGEGAGRLELRALTKTFFTDRGPVTAVNDLTLTAAAGEFVCICGPSGCGKSTLFNLIAGIERPTSGSVWLNSRDVTGSMLGHVGYMFQKDLLVPWLTVTENVALGLKVKGRHDQQAEAHAGEYMRRYGLAGFENAYPRDLSGGMRQRVALIRTIVLGNDIILMDEPFAALDYPTKLALEDDVRAIASELDKTVLFVTHDIEEAVSMADRLVVLSKSPGTVKSVYELDLFKRTGSVVAARGAHEFRDWFNKVWGELETTTLPGEGPTNNSGGQS